MLNRSRRVLEGHPGRVLLSMALPMMLGVFGMVAFNLADTYFVGRLGTLPLAALSFTFPVVFVIASISMGLGIGTSSVVSRAIGASSREEVRDLTTSAVALAVIVVTFFAAVGFIFLDPVFRSLGAGPEVLPLIREYMTIWLVGMPFVVIPMVGNNAIRATGDTTTPALVMLTAAGLNILLDPILIFGWGPIPALGIRGAAIATVFARATTLVVSLWVLAVRDKMLVLRLPRRAVLLDAWKRVAFVGVPAAATQLITPVSLGIVTRLVAGFGTAAVAAFGVASRIETFSLAFVQALGSVSTPFFGQNFAAGNRDRLLTATRWATVYAVGWGAVLYAAVLVAGEALAAIFTDDPKVARIVVRYLVIVAGSYGLQGLVLFGASAFNGLNLPLRAATVALVRLFVVYIPLALVFRALFGLSGIFWGAFGANVCAGLLAFVWTRRTVAEVPAG
ncbi:MAG: MATE family efflux transporter [Spirochaetaceae bacterium]